jgi:large subunit ribosomal protein L29
MKASEIRALSASEKESKLVELYKKEASIRISVGHESFTQTHQLSEVKRTIARFKTIMSEEKVKEGS